MPFTAARKIFGAKEAAAAVAVAAAAAAALVASFVGFFFHSVLFLDANRITTACVCVHACRLRALCVRERERTILCVLPSHQECEVARSHSHIGVALLARTHTHTHTQAYVPEI